MAFHLRSILLLLCASFFITSCGNSQPSNQAASSALVKKNYVAVQPSDLGIVKDSQTISKEIGSPAYAIYLPHNYSPDKKFPVMYFFDAHARAALPLIRYGSIADRLGVIMVGCYSSRNGIQWQGNREAILKLMDYIQNSYNIDSSKIYVSGFSGGSRVAASLAAELDYVSGVVGCAAGYAAGGNMLARKFAWFGIAGDYDFNLSEMKQLDAQLGEKSYAHQLLALSGYHDWPSAEDFEMPLLWLRVNEIKNKIAPADTAVINQLTRQYNHRIEANKKAGDYLKTYQLLKGEADIFAGISDVSAVTKEIEQFQSSPNMEQVKADPQLAREEMQLQASCKQQAMSLDESGLKAMVTDLKTKAKSSKTLAERLMHQRVLNYLNLIFYLASDGSIKAGRDADAAKFLSVFTFTDPVNPDVNYLRAVLLAGKNDFQGVLTELTKAEQLGYNQPETIMFNPVFGQYLSRPEFINLLKSLKEKQK